MIKQKFLYSGIFICGIFSIFPAVASDPAGSGAYSDSSISARSQETALPEQAGDKRARPPEKASAVTSNAAKTRRTTDAAVTESDSSTSSASASMESGSSTSSASASVERVSSTCSIIQKYGIATYDALFKYVLSDDSIRLSFLRTFIPTLKIESSKRIDEHMSPVQELQHVRKLIHGRATAKAVAQLGAERIGIYDSESAEYKEDPKATEIFNKISAYFKDIKKAFPAERYDGTMDFSCNLSDGGYALVEMQVIPCDYWDQRALAYAAAFYGNQLRRSGEWKDLKKVIALNILGGGKDDLCHWNGKPGEYIRHYKMQEQRHPTEHRFIEGLDIIQYSIMNAPAIEQPALKDWIMFFKEGHRMTEQDVSNKITTEAVKEAFKRAELNNLPHKVRALYESQDRKYDRYSQHTNSAKEEARKEGIAQGRMKTILEAVRKVRGKGTSDDDTAEALSAVFYLTPEEVALATLSTDAIEAKLKALGGAVVTSEAGAAAGSA